MSAPASLGAMAIGLPLLSKELLEASTRRRTWWLRAAAAAAALITFASVHAAQAARFQDSLGLLGRGEPMFSALVWLLVLATLVMAPALGAGCIARERERGTLVLLLLTPMRPLELAVGKWLSIQAQVMVPLLVALPLVAITYAYGGFSPERLLSGLLAPFLASMQAGAIAVLASAWARGTVPAAILAYAGIAVVALAGNDASSPTIAWGIFLVPALELAPLDLLIAVTPILGTVPICLILAGWLMPRRVATPGGGWWRLYVRAIDRLVGKRLLARARRLQPVADDAPIAWRDRTRRSLTSWPGLARILGPVVIGFAAFAAGSLLLDEPEDGAEILYGACLVMHALGWLALLVLGSSLLNAERTGQTLEVLRTTALPPREIIKQKVRGLENVFWAMLIAHVTGIVATVVVHPPLGIAAFFTACAAVFALPPFLYLAVLIGLRERNPIRALVGTMLATVGAGFVMLLGLVVIGFLAGMLGFVGALLTPIAIPVLLVIAARSLRERCYARAESSLALSG